MTISGKKIDYKYFLFDGCHKFYLADRFTEDMKKAGYDKNDFHPIDKLPYMFYNSCSLRFIETWDNFKRIVPQCRNIVTFKGFGRYGYTARMNFAKDKVYTDESLFPASNIVFRNMN